MSHMDTHELKSQAVAETLRAERAACRMSQSDVAARSGIPRQTYIRYETGERRITVAQAIAVAEAMGMTFEAFARKVDARLAELLRPALTQGDEVKLAAWDKRTEPSHEGGGL